MKNNTKSNEITTIQLYNDEHIELPYPINSNEFNLDGPYLLYKILFYEIQHMNNELNDLRKKVKELLKVEE